ncbi:site-specific integrase [Lysobacter enzymogenes]|nr:site-specific integrase [Lysobacter enzymogenes]
MTTPHSNSSLPLFSIACINIGRFKMHNANIYSDAGAIRFQETLNYVSEATRRPSRAGTRYPQQLALHAPARVLSLEMRDFLKDLERCNSSTLTVKAYTRTLGLLMRVTGDVPVSRIDHADIHKMWELLRWAPEDCMTNPSLLTKTPEELIEIGKIAGKRSPAAATLERHRRFLNAFFNALTKAGAIGRSPLAAFKPIKSDLISDPSQPERFYTAADLQKIFDPKTFIPWAMKYPHRWWAPMLGMHTAMRVNEVAQLKVRDIVCENGTWCIAIQKTADEDLSSRGRAVSRQSLKGESARRTLPIPQELIDAGFLDFISDLKTHKCKRLFPNLSAGVNKKTGLPNGRYGQGLMNQFAPYLRRLGIPAGVAFHAFRHTFATTLLRKKVRDVDIALITGHSVKHAVPVLHQHYYHIQAQELRDQQKELLELFKPNVALPVYIKGQFDDLLKDKVKHYP